MPSTSPQHNPKISTEGVIGLDFSLGSRAPSNTQVCTECWLRKHQDQFGPTDDICSDCKETMA